MKVRISCRDRLTGTIEYDDVIEADGEDSMHTAYYLITAWTLGEDKT